MVVQMANSKSQMINGSHDVSVVVGDRSARIAIASMPVSFSEDLRWCIVRHHLYKEASPQDIAEALYVSEMRQ